MDNGKLRKLKRKNKIPKMYGINLMYWQGQFSQCIPYIEREKTAEHNIEYNIRLL